MRKKILSEPRKKSPITLHLFLLTSSYLALQAPTYPVLSRDLSSTIAIPGFHSSSVSKNNLLSKNIYDYPTLVSGTNTEISSLTDNQNIIQISSLIPTGSLIIIEILKRGASQILLAIDESQALTFDPAPTTNFNPEFRDSKGQILSINANQVDQDGFVQAEKFLYVKKIGSNIDY